MTPYGILAGFYDTLMSDVDYKARTDYIKQIFERHGLAPKIVLDAACGTGNISFALKSMGYDVIGADLSADMLAVAMQKGGGQNPLFLNQDIRKLDLFGTVDAAVCVLDGINHLLSPQSVTAAFSSIALFTVKGGLFVFDLNTPYKFEKILGNNTFVYDYDDIYCVWQNSFNAGRGICRFDLTFFIENRGSYGRSDENFCERAYTPRQIEKYLCKAGFRLEALYDDLSFHPPAADSERAVYVARRI